MPEPNEPLEFNPISEEEERRRRMVAEQIARAYGKKNPQFAPQQVAPKPDTKPGNGRIPLQVTLGSLALFVVLESFAFGFWYALCIAAVIFIHEIGHLTAAVQRKVPAVGIIMIPFIGGVALSGRRGDSAKDDAYIGILGPIFGLATGLVIVAAYLVTHIYFLGRFAEIVFWMHLMNMIPIPPLDGSHVLPMLRKPQPGVRDSYLAGITTGQKIGYVALYIGVALFAAIGAFLIRGSLPVR